MTEFEAVLQRSLLATRTIHQLYCPSNIVQ